MIRIKPYRASDVDTILSWCQDEKSFYQWTAGILGNYPITQKEFCFVESLMPFRAFLRIIFQLITVIKQSVLTM